MKKLLLLSAVAAALVVAVAGCAQRAKVTIPAPGKGLGFGEGGEGALGDIPLGQGAEGPFGEASDYPDPAAKEIFVDVHFDYNKAEIRGASARSSRGSRTT